MYNIWPLIIILLCFLFILFIIIRRFPALAVLDVDNIPEEKERQIKEKIIRERIRRKFFYFDKFFSFLSVFFNKISKHIWDGLDGFKKKQEKRLEDVSLESVDLDVRIKLLFSQVKEFVKSESWIDAEKKLIEIISLDDKNLLAFFELGELYHSEGKLQEARQTLLYSLKLAETCNDKPKQAEINYNLSLISKETGNVDGAILDLSKALEKDKNNPRYLDLMLNLCIIKKDKTLALEYLSRIKEVNPDNKNILEWEENIDKI